MNDLLGISSHKNVIKGHDLKFNTFNKITKHKLTYKILVYKIEIKLKIQDFKNLLIIVDTDYDITNRIKINPKEKKKIKQE